MKKIIPFFAVLFMVVFFEGSASAFNFDFKNIKLPKFQKPAFINSLHMPKLLDNHLPWCEGYKFRKYQKEQENEGEPMVQTVQEWEERAIDIGMEHRVEEPYKGEENPNLVEKLDLPTFFEKYNSAPGSKEADLQMLQRDKSVRSQGVISPDFKLMAYTEYYYHPSEQKTSSAFFIYPLDMSKGKKQRVLDANVFAGARKTPLISSSREVLKQYLFSAITIVDWSKDNKKVLLKEKMGSSVEGIYQTVVQVYFINDENDAEDGYVKKFDRLNDVIVQYMFYKDRLNLKRYRWDIKPLGFLADNENIVICAAYTYDEKNKENIFLGSWSINIVTDEIKLVSDTPDNGFEISTNGLVLIKRMP